MKNNDTVIPVIPAELQIAVYRTALHAQRDAFLAHRAQEKAAASQTANDAKVAEAAKLCGEGFTLADKDGGLVCEPTAV